MMTHELRVCPIHSTGSCVSMSLFSTISLSLDRSVFLGMRLRSREGLN